jgi:hypothetical protein
VFFCRVIFLVRIWWAVLHLGFSSFAAFRIIDVIAFRVLGGFRSAVNVPSDGVFV